VEKYGRSPGSKDSKPRPAVILPDDRFDATESICVMTIDPAEAPLFRVPIAPNERNGLNSLSPLIVDKITTVPKISSDTASDISMSRIWSASIKPSLFFWIWAASGSAAVKGTPSVAASVIGRWSSQRNLNTRRFLNDLGSGLPTVS